MLVTFFINIMKIHKEFVTERILLTGTGKVIEADLKSEA